MTMEQAFIQARLIELGVTIECNRVLKGIEHDGVALRLRLYRPSASD